MTKIGIDCFILLGVIIYKSNYWKQSANRIRVQIGYNTVIKKGTVIEDDVLIGSNASIGSDGFQIIRSNGYNRHIRHCGGVYISEGAVITASVTLCGSTVIEKEAWVGMNSTILNKVTVGKNSLIGIGSVVTRDVMANTLTYGVPAKKRRDI